MQTVPLFPECFSEAHTKLRRKFRDLDMETIEDGLQKARLEYWCQHIYTTIPNESEAFGWFLNIAHRYLYKESKRAERLCSLSQAEDKSVDDDLETRIINRDLLDSLNKFVSPISASVVLDYAKGYSLNEIADSDHLSIDAVKQRHARAQRILREHAGYFLH